MLQCVPVFQKNGGNHQRFFQFFKVGFDYFLFFVILKYSLLLFSLSGMLVIRTKDSELSLYSFTRPLFSVKLFNLTGNFSIITDCSLFLEGLPTRFLSVIILSISSLMSNSEFLCFFRKSSIAFCASGLQANGLWNDFFISASIDFFSFSMFFITLFSGSYP